jgi:hypothetical protein
MYIIIAMGEEPRNVEIPCMLFKEKQDAKDYIHEIPWLQCFHDDEVDNAGEPDPIAMYEVLEELYDTPMPHNILAFLPRDIIHDEIVKVNKGKITYGQATGLCFFIDYNDRHDRVYDYWLREIRTEELLVSFGDETTSIPYKGG